MSQTGAHAQWKTGTNGVTAFVAGYLVENGSAGHYKLSATGPADAILTDSGDGTLRITTTGTAAGRVYAPDGTTNFRIFR